jgi:hypothetical protein
MSQNKLQSLEKDVAGLRDSVSLLQSSMQTLNTTLALFIQSQQLPSKPSHQEGVASSASTSVPQKSDTTSSSEELPPSQLLRRGTAM